MGFLTLVDVYEHVNAEMVLWQILLEREANSSPKTSWEDHISFIQSRPHREWYIITDGKQTAYGSIFLSWKNELAVHILKVHRGRGHGWTAMHAMILRHADEPLFANVNPLNPRGRRLVEQLGFRPRQIVYERALTVVPETSQEEPPL